MRGVLLRREWSVNFGWDRGLRVVHHPVALRRTFVPETRPASSAGGTLRTSDRPSSRVNETFGGERIPEPRFGGPASGRYERLDEFWSLQVRGSELHDGIQISFDPLILPRGNGGGQQFAVQVGENRHVKQVSIGLEASTPCSV